MSNSEFNLIERYFARCTTACADVVLGVGDDCALLSIPEGMELAVSMDTLVAGVHFPLETRAEDIGHKVLAASLSDIAAMGATPRWATLALTLPQVDELWLAGIVLPLRKHFSTMQLNFSLVLDPLQWAED